MIDLKPCPFCGMSDRVKMWHSDKYEDRIYVVECKTCDCGGPSTLVSAERAADLWNDRLQVVQ